MTAPSEAWWTIASIVALCMLGALYGTGLQRLWLQRGTGAVISKSRAMVFAGGLAALAAAIIGPVHAVAERSFTGHMAQHMLLMVVAAPLLGAGGSALPMIMATPRPIRKRLNRIRASAAVRWLRRPANRALIGGSTFTAVIWMWHLPGPYLFAVQSPAAHAAEHISLVVVSWLVWSAVFSPDRHRLAGPLGFLLLFGIGMAGAALGAVLTLSPTTLYPAQVYVAGGDALADQQIAGLVMWVPMDVVVLVLALTIFGRWLAGLQRDFPSDVTAAQPRPIPEVVP